METILNKLRSVLCDPEGKCCISGSDADRTIVDEALAVLATQPLEQKPVAYLDIGAGGYVDLGSDLTPEQLQAMPRGRHALAIVGTFGIDGYVAAQPEQVAQDREHAENYRLIRRGQHWSVVDGIGNTLRGDDLDAAVDAIRAARASGKGGRE